VLCACACVLRKLNFVPHRTHSGKIGGVGGAGGAGGGLANERTRHFASAYNSFGSY